MTRPTALAALALAATLGATPRPAVAAADEELPGAGALTPGQREVLAQVADEEFCYCGCPHTLSTCLRQHRSCKHAPRMISLAARLAASGATAGEIRRSLAEYYAGFEPGKRAKLDLGAFGPPLGSPGAPVVIVEFSDFTCPYCRLLRPELERFVREHEGRVRLFYKPYPIASHPRAMEAALAAVWARDKGLFWKMHDLLFARPHELADDDLAAGAQEIGGDPEDLLRALAAGRHRARITASQAEARAAGLLGTPTLFLDGRRIQLPMAAGEIRDVLTFVLEDEEEWIARDGWTKD